MSEYFIQNDAGDYEPAKLPSFSEGIPEDLRGNEHIKGIDNAGDMATKLIEVTGKFNDVSAKMPVVPESADAYEYTFDKKLPIMEEDVKEFKALAHKLGIPQETFKGVLDFYVAREAKQIEKLNADIKKAKTEGDEALKKDWGDKYEPNMEQFKTFRDTILPVVLGEDGAKEFAQFMEDSGFGNQPQVIKFFWALSNSTKEDSFHPGPAAKPGETIVKDSTGRRVFSSYKKTMKGTGS